MEDVEMEKQEILNALKKEIIKLNKQVTEEAIQEASREELIQYLELMSKIKEELNLV